MKMIKNWKINSKKLSYIHKMKIKWIFILTKYKIKKLLYNKKLVNSGILIQMLIDIGTYLIKNKIIKSSKLIILKIILMKKTQIKFDYI
jgi:hypothetical protein